MANRFATLVIAVFAVLLGTSVALRLQSSSKPNFGFPSSAVIPRPFPLFKQCDYRWGSHNIFNETVCAVGCLMSSCASALNGQGLLLTGGTLADPGTLNAWLLMNNGYVGDNDLDENALVKVAPGLIEYDGMVIPATKWTEDQLRAEVDAGTIVIANVDNGHHFVLIVGYDRNTRGFVYVNDSGFPRISYRLDQIVGLRVFRMKRIPQRCVATDGFDLSVFTSTTGSYAAALGGATIEFDVCSPIACNSELDVAGCMTSGDQTGSTGIYTYQQIRRSNDRYAIMYGGPTDWNTTMSIQIACNASVPHTAGLEWTASRSASQIVLTAQSALVCKH